MITWQPTRLNGFVSEPPGAVIVARPSGYEATYVNEQHVPIAARFPNADAAKKWVEGVVR